MKKKSVSNESARANSVASANLRLNYDNYKCSCVIQWRPDRAGDGRVIVSRKAPRQEWREFLKNVIIRGQVFGRRIFGLCRAMHRCASHPRASSARQVLIAICLMTVISIPLSSNAR